MSDVANLDSTERAPRGAAVAWVSLALSAAALLFPLLAVPAMLVVLFAFVTQRQPTVAVKAALAATLLLMALAMIRFTVTEAAPGVIEGGRRAQAKSALYHLRALVFAQDVSREQAFLDPDGDGVGSALGLKALVGQAMRDGSTPRLPLLARFGKVTDHQGAAVSTFQGYGIVVYLPTKDDQAVADQSDAIDDEAAERRFVAYAWPLDVVHDDGDRSVIFVDERERILVSDNLGPQQGYVGLDNMPPFWAALSDKRMSANVARGAPSADGGTWTPWKGKKARAKLPGDR
jgi:hypothetical protein